MKHRNRILHLVVFVLLVSGCSPMVSTPSPAEKLAYTTEFSKATTENTEHPQTTWAEAMPADIPEPSGVEEYEDTEYGLECLGISKSNFAAYQSLLVQCGFHMAGNQNSNDLVYIKDHHMLSISNQTGGEYSLAVIAYTRLKTDSDIQQGELNITQAIKMIQDYIETQDNAGSFSFVPSVGELIHVEIPEAWVKMHLQAFHSFTLQKSFIIQEGKVAEAIIGDTCVADIDGDGVYELLSLFSFGSGIITSAVTVYKNGKQYTANSWRGFALGIEKVDEYTVKLKSLYYMGNRKKHNSDYGKLTIVTEGNIIRIIPETEPG